MASASDRRVFSSDQRTLTLSTLVKSGGAGSVYRLQEAPQQLAKVYHAHVERTGYERKLLAMVGLPPQLPEVKEEHQACVQLAWPDALLYDKASQFIGFVMPLLDMEATVELEYVLQERQARAASLPTGLGAKTALAANLCALVAELHRKGHRVVDLKPVNLRFHRRLLYVTMLDCDGFSIQGQQERFPAPQYTPEYLAPELHAQGVSEASEEQQDCFALAVVVFQLLNFGIHPYAGRPSSDRVPTDLASRIRGRYYAYGLRAHAKLAPNLASGHGEMPTELRRLFDRAFEAKGPTRPAASEWAESLERYARPSRGGLVVCRRHAEHQHFAGHACAACLRLGVLSRAAAAAPKKGKLRAAKARPRSAPKRRGRPAPASASHTTWRTSSVLAPGLRGSSNNAVAVFLMLLLVLLVIVCQPRSCAHRQESRADTYRPNAETSFDEPRLPWPPNPLPGPETVPPFDLGGLARAVAAGDRPLYEKDWEALRQASLVKRSNSGVDRRSFGRAMRAYHEALGERANRLTREAMWQYGGESDAEAEAISLALEAARRANPFDGSTAQRLGSARLANYCRKYASHREAIETGRAEERNSAKREVEEARSAAQKALSWAVYLEPERGVSWYGLGLTYEGNDEIDSAVGALAISRMEPWGDEESWPEMRARTGTPGGVLEGYELFQIMCTYQVARAQLGRPRVGILEARARVAVAKIRDEPVHATVQAEAAEKLPPRFKLKPAPPQHPKPGKRRHRKATAGG